jgi:hypothetical protein
VSSGVWSLLPGRLVASPNSDRSIKLSQPVGTYFNLPYTVEVRRPQQLISNGDTLYGLSVHLKFSYMYSGFSDLVKNEGLKLTKFVRLSS